MFLISHRSLASISSQFPNRYVSYKYLMKCLSWCTGHLCLDSVMAAMRLLPLAAQFDSAEETTTSVAIPTKLQLSVSHPRILIPESRQSLPFLLPATCLHYSSLPLRKSLCRNSFHPECCYYGPDIYELQEGIMYLTAGALPKDRTCFLNWIL